MFKKLVLTLAAGAALAGAGTTALAQATWSFELPDFQLQRDRSTEDRCTEASAFSRFAAGPRETMTDASGEARAADVDAATEAARFGAVFSPLYAN